MRRSVWRDASHREGAHEFPRAAAPVRRIVPGTAVPSRVVPFSERSAGPLEGAKGGMPDATRYIPALRFEALTRFYDPVVALTTREGTFKRRLLAQAALEPKQDVLDLGCGTGTLAIWAARAEPSAGVTALDGDPAVLTRARKKAERANVSIQFDQGLSYELPYSSQRFDRVLSSLFFHHLLPADKERTLAEVLRVLRAGGELHIADWGRPTTRLMRVLFFSVQLLDGFPNTRQHVAGELPLLLQSSGFEQVAVRAELATLYGTLALYSARKPA